MKNRNLVIFGLVLLSAVLLSLPWLVPHAGLCALVGFVPLLCAERIATLTGMKRFFLWHYLAFVLWNAFTTFWVCNATVGGGVFAVLANALQMSLVFGLFRFSRRRFSGALPYIFLMVAWIAWERAYFPAEVSWPWLVLGNAFAGTTKLVQWYSITGTLGGSLWIWAVNLSLFGLMVSLSDGSWWMRHPRGRGIMAALLVLLVAGPVVASEVMYHSYEERSEGTIDVLVGQPNLDPYHKFESMTQAQQNAVLLDVFEKGAEGSEPDLYVAPETFTSDIVIGNLPYSPTCEEFRHFLTTHQGAQMLFGASTYDISLQRSRPSVLARPYGDGWIVNHNSAVLMDVTGRTQLYHKSRLVVGVEKTPWPAFMTKVDDMLGGVMGRCEPQEEVGVLNLSDSVSIGCAVCYESIYGEFCTGYVEKGAKAMAVITNDAWWGDTPGYRQHLNYSRLRAIELRRDFARCANTGISAFIDQRGDILERTTWWEVASLRGKLNLNGELTPFVRFGDVTGKVCTFAFLLLLLALVARLFVRTR